MISGGANLGNLVTTRRAPRPAPLHGLASSLRAAPGYAPPAAVPRRFGVRVRVVNWLLPAAGVFVAAATFVASLPFDAVRYASFTYPAVNMLALGWLGPFCGQAGWFGNPLLWLAWALLLAPWRASSWVALALALAATLVAATSFYTLVAFDMMGANEATSAGPFVGFGPAIWLWFASFLVTDAVALVAVIVRAFAARSARAAAAPAQE